MLPDIVDEININEIIENETTNISNIGKSFLFDFEKGDFLIQDGKLAEVKGMEAIKEWAEKILRTEKFKFKIYEKDYEDEYGITIKDLIIGYNYSKEFIEAEIRREVTEALLKHSLIERLDNWIIEKNNPVLKISFRIILKNGTTFDEEVSY